MTGGGWGERIQKGRTGIQVFLKQHFSLFFGKFSTMYFELLPAPPSHAFPPFLVISLFLPSFPIESGLSCPAVLQVGPVLVCVHLPGVTSFKKTDSPSPHSYQMPVASQLMVGLYASLPPRMLQFFLAVACVGLVHAAPIPVNSHNRSVLSGKHLFLMVMPLRSFPLFREGSYGNRPPPPHPPRFNFLFKYQGRKTNSTEAPCCSYSI